MSIATRITATLSVLDCVAAIEFYKAAFHATELFRVPDGGVAQLAVDGADFWVAEESRENQNFAPKTLGGCSVRMLIVTDDPHAFCRHAIAQGAKEIVPVSDGHGWRIGRLLDPFGHHWEIARPLD